MTKKQDLPVKICTNCGRPFTWRKKWRNNWENVLYCSRRCSGERSSAANDRLPKEADKEA